MSSPSQYTFTWKIKKFLSCYQLHGEYMESPSFRTDDLTVKEWQLWLYPRGNKETKNSTDHTIVFLMRKRPDEILESVLVDINIEVMDPNGGKIAGENQKTQKLETNGVCGIFIRDSTQDLFQLLESWIEDTLTIRCTLTSCNNTYKPQESGYEAVTVLDTNRFLFKWSVSDKGYFTWKDSVAITNSEKPDVEIVLSVVNENIIINILPLNESLLRKPVVFALAFLTKNGIEIASRRCAQSFDSLDAWQFPTFIKLKELIFGSCDINRYEYKFIFDCTVSKNCIAFSSIETCSEDLTIKNDLSPTIALVPNLQKDFRELYTSKRYSDVKLKVGKHEFFAHKSILAARSPVFSAMFDQDMLENRTGAVDIKDMDENTLSTFLEFMYTETLSEMDCESAIKLLLAADKYQVVDLKNKCSSIIFSFLSEENVLEVFSIADMVNHETLKAFALKYISANVSKVFASSSWPQWVEANVKLAAEIICNVAKSLK